MGEVRPNTATVWTPETIIAAIRRFHDERGYQPVSREACLAYQLPPYWQIVRAFGSWNGAIAAAGFRPYPAQSSAQAKTLAYRDRNPRAA